MGSRQLLITCTVFSIWLLTVIFIAFHHELWRDEVRAFSIAKAADSLSDLHHLLKNEGHPILWYFILWLVFKTTNVTFAVKIVSIIIAFGSVLLFWLYSPFKAWFKLLFIFSWLPLYEYSVMVRNYGISMLLFFCFAVLFQKQRRSELVTWGIFSTLFLLANTNFHSTMCVPFLLAYCLNTRYSLFHRNNGRTVLDKQLILPYLLAISGVVYACLTVQPDSNSIVFQPSSVTLGYSLKVILQTILNPAKHFEELLSGLPTVTHNVLIYLLLLGLLIQPRATVLSFFLMVTFGVFFTLCYAGSLRHEGIYFLFVIIMYWLTLNHEKSKPEEKRNVYLWFNFKLCLYGLLTLLLASHVIGSLRYYKRDYTRLMSSSKVFADFLQSDERYQGAIIIGEPDLGIESMPYYVDNPIYLPREKKFQKFVRLTKANSNSLSLNELLSDARRIQKEENKPVIIALGHFYLGDQKPPLERTSSYGKTFTWTEESLMDFRNSTQKIAGFAEDYRAERYEIYLLLNKTESKFLSKPQ